MCNFFSWSSSAKLFFGKLELYFTRTQKMILLSVLPIRIYLKDFFMAIPPVVFCINNSSSNRENGMSPDFGYTFRSTPSVPRGKKNSIPKRRRCVIYNFFRPSSLHLGRRIWTKKGPLSLTLSGLARGGLNGRTDREG